jgi:phosphatidylglycerophosphatase C
MSNPVVNLYDFDHTIYQGDVSVDFMIYCLKRYPKTWRGIPRYVVAVISLLLRLRTRKDTKELAFSFLRYIPDIDRVVSRFWSSHESRIAPWYLRQKQSSDIIISASPDFLIQPMATSLGVQVLLATRMNPRTGKINGENCRGEEKIKRLRAYDKTLKVAEAYSDSLSDAPLFHIATKAFIVRRDKIFSYNTEKVARE